MNVLIKQAKLVKTLLEIEDVELLEQVILSIEKTIKQHESDHSNTGKRND